MGRKREENQGETKNCYPKIAIYARHFTTYNALKGLSTICTYICTVASTATRMDICTIQTNRTSLMN